MTYNKKSVEDIDVSGKKVLVRCDFNVPMKDGKITDETRINGALPTIKYLLSKNAAVILCSHMGRPKGEFNPAVSPSLPLQSVSPSFSDRRLSLPPTLSVRMQRQRQPRSSPARS